MEVTFTPEFIASFWARFDKNGPVPAHKPELGPCWVWTGAIGSHGYGQVSPAGRKVGPKTVHRLAYLIAGGVLAAGEYVCHHCDHRPCGRPDHLFKGGAGANAQDRESKGRGNHHHYPIALTAEQVLAMRAAYKNGSAKSYAELARQYGVSVSAARQAVLRVTWRHLP